MSQFQPMETLALIIFQVILENILDEFYEVLVNVLLEFYSKSCDGNIYLCDDLWVMILIQFEVLSQTFPSYLQVTNMVNAVLHPHKKLPFSIKVLFYQQYKNILSLNNIYFLLFVI